jgi:hypothetical protein
MENNKRFAASNTRNKSLSHINEVLRKSNYTFTMDANEGQRATANTGLQ